ncbi:hypothetical protein B0A50_07316 [Salinomyces thailandicus]|uniref:FHA domain-containing protein n=1 Tax=Salinomyces thailandicus TaxID=706561 RepID=A0A4V5N5U4_9PEZI|nr:hypothetical protein B0A50_07316 [Salinomyces thailandica]
MWTLECDGQLFEGKRRWLRPGSIHVLGRTSGKPENGERIAYITEKSVSRKHLVITVGRVEAGDSGRVHKRSEIQLEDSSKVGSWINDEHVARASKTLDGSNKEYTIRLGRYEHLFKLKWEPVVLTFTGLGKKTQGLAEQRQRLEGTDVKLLSEYVTNQTTHSVNKKRNMPQALQALLQGRWLVSYEWVDELAEVVERNGVDADGEPASAPLEEDFDGNWPKEERFPVPAGHEPHPRTNDYVLPNPERAEVFQDFIFVLLSASQYESLMPIITSGGGKALLWEVEIGESSVEDLIDYVKEVAGGKKRDKAFQLSQHTARGGVVVVRIHEKTEDGRPWTVPFMQDLERSLNQRAIEQSEFLDPILTLNTSGLRRQLIGADSVPTDSIQRSSPRHRSHVQEEQPRAEATEHDIPAEHAPPSAQPEPEEESSEQAPVPTSTAAARRRTRRPLGKSRFKAFDDIDMSQYAHTASRSPEPYESSMREPSQAASVQSMDVDDEGLPSRTQQTQEGTRKRPAPVEEEPEPEEDVYERMFPGQAALKRRKTEAAKLGETSSFSKATLEAEKQAAEKSAKAKKKKEKQIDVQAELKARRGREDELRRKDEETLREMMEGVDIDELRNLAQVEQMDVPERQPPSRGPDARGHSDRWDPAWNGRKNFKNFRPQGQHRDGPRLQRVIVTLEEVPRKGHGIGEEYWLPSSATTNKSKSKSQSKSQSVHAGLPADTQDTGDTACFRRGIQSSYVEDQQRGFEDDVHPAEIAGHARDAGLEAIANANSTLSQALRTESQRKAVGKRPAAQQSGGPAKKARQTTLARPSREAAAAVNLDDVDDDDDDDDGLKFRRRRR